MDAVAGVTNTYTGIMSKYSSSFQNFILGLGEARSKAEEDRIVQEAIVYMKRNMKKPDITIKQRKEYFIQLMYCSMLGHDVGFSHIDAVNFIQQPKYINLAEKRTGYAALMVFCDDTYETECTMNMNNMIKDLNSNQTTEICFALTAAAQLIFKEILPAILPLVEKLVKHADEQVRKKAVMTLLKFYQLDSTENIHLKKVFYEALKDPSASVMAVTLNAFHTFILDEGAEGYRNLTSTFVCLLKQVLNFQITKMNHKNVPAPWLQIKLLQILGLLGKQNLEESQKMYEILKICFNASNTQTPIYCAIGAECIKTICKIHPHDLLIEMAVTRAGTFLVSKNYNLKYLGMSSMQEIVEIDPLHSTKYQMEIINCLSDHDDTLKWKTLGLLYKIANSTNVKLICEKMLKYLRSTVDEYIREELVANITDLAEKYAPDNGWYIETMNEVFEIGGDLVSDNTVYNMMLLLGEGLESDAETDDLRRHAVISYVEMLERSINSLPDVLVKLISWVLGEYMSIIDSYDVTETLKSFYSLMLRDFKDRDTKSWIVSAIVKLLSRQKNWRDCLQPVKSFSTSNCGETHVEMLNSLYVYENEIETIFPYDESCDEVDFDQMFVAIDNHVNNALANGMKPYCDESKRLKVSVPSHEKPGVRDGSLLFVHAKPENEFAEDQKSSLETDLTDAFTTQPSNNKYPVNAVSHKPVWGVSGRLPRSPISVPPHDTDTPSNTPSLSSDDTSQKTGDSKDSPRHLPNVILDSPSRREVGDGFFSGMDSSSSTAVSRTMKPRGKGMKRESKKDLINMIDSDSLSQISTNRVLNKLDASSPSNNDDSLVNILSYDNLNEDREDLFAGLQVEDSNVLLDTDIKFQVHDNHQSEVSSNISSKPDTSGGNGKDTGLTNTNTDSVSQTFIERSNLFDDLDFSTNEEEEVSTKVIDSINDVNEIHLDSINDLNEIHPDSINDLNEIHPDSINDLNEIHPDSINDLNEIHPKDMVNKQLLNTSQLTSLETNQSSMELPDYLKTYPSSKEKFNLSSDNNFRVMCQMVYKPNDTPIVLFLFNQTVQKVTDVKLSIKPPTNLNVLEESSLINEMNEIAAMTSIYREFCVTLKHPALNMELSGDVTYKDFRNVEKRIFIRHKLPFSVLLRPLHLTRKAYEEKWLNKALYEKREKINVKTKVKPLTILLKEKCYIQTVQVTGQEFIASTSVLNEQDILLYFSTKDHIFVSVKSNSKQLNNCILKMINNAITEPA